MKKCSKCREYKELLDFSKDKYKSDGLYSSCRDCNNFLNNSKERRERSKNPKYKLIQRKYKLKKFGITLEYYEQMIKEQNNCCAICKTSQEKLTKLLSIDHDHKTGKVRGLLCGKCNRALGYFNDNIKTIEKAIEYVTKNT